jgi:hypothetical protein
MNYLFLNANANADDVQTKMKEMQNKIEFLEIQIKEIKTTQKTNINIVIDIYKYYKSTVSFGTISINSALDMIYNKFFQYTCKETDLLDKNIILQDYEKMRSLL